MGTGEFRRAMQVHKNHAVQTATDPVAPPLAAAAAALNTLPPLPTLFCPTHSSLPSLTAPAALASLVAPNSLDILF